MINPKLVELSENLHMLGVGEVIEAAKLAIIKLDIAAADATQLVESAANAAAVKVQEAANSAAVKVYEASVAAAKLVLDAANG